MVSNNFVIIKDKPQMSFIDYPTAKGSALVYFIKGCRHHCRDCQNVELQAINYDSSTDLSFVDPEQFADYLYEMDTKKNMSQRKVIFQGGDPLYESNRDFIINTIAVSYTKYPDLKYCIYTGYELDRNIDRDNDLGRYERTGLNIVDTDTWTDNVYKALEYIKCGKFEIDNLNDKPGKHDNKLVLASKNQTMYKSVPEESMYKLISINGILDLQ